MSKIFFEVLGREQRGVFLNLGKTGILGTLSGGTVIAFQLKHRKSFDFDIFLPAPLEKNLIFKINKVFPKEKIKVLVDSEDELIFLAGETKNTYLYFPLSPLHKIIPTRFLPLFSLRDLKIDLKKDCKVFFTQGVGGSERVYFLPKIKARLGKWGRIIPVDF